MDSRPLLRSAASLQNSVNCDGSREAPGSSYGAINDDESQTVIRDPSTEEHVLSNEYESLDYEEVHNKIYVAEESDEIGRIKGCCGWDQVWVRSFSRWAVMLVVGALTALVACAIDVSIDKLSYIKHLIIQEAYRRFTDTNPFPLPLLVWVVLNTLLVGFAAFLVAVIAPVAAGSGIPQIKCYLNGVKIPKVVRIKTLICKAVGVTFSVAGGLAVGKEGPMIHSGAVIAAGISQGRSTSLKKDFGFFEYFRSDHEKRDFVSGGAAAGVSAAFGAPVGGVLFALEEGASFWNQALTWRIFLCSMVSYITLNAVLSWYMTGTFGDVQYRGLLNFGKFDNLHYLWWEIPVIFAPMAMVGGFLGALFNFINIKLTNFRQKHVTRRFTKVIEAMLVAIVTATAFFLFIYFEQDCQEYGKDPTEIPVQAFCSDGQVSSVATLLLQTPEKSVRSLFHDPPDSYRLGTLCAFFAIYFFLALWTYGISVPSGLFIPSLLCGAAWGRLLGDLFWKYIPTFFAIDNGTLANLNPGKYALIGAAAQLGGIVRMTISLTVILMEATGDVSFGLPLMITLMITKWFGDLFTEGIYDEHIGLGKIPILGWEAPPLTTNRRALDIMSTPVTVFRPVEKVAVIFKHLMTESHNGFPIVTQYDPEMSDAVGLEDDDLDSPSCLPDARGRPGKKLKSFGRLVGFVTRSQLLVLLKARTYVEGTTRDHVVRADDCPFDTNAVTSQHLPSPPLLKCADFRDAYPRYPDIRTIPVPEAEFENHIDLRPYMNDSPYHMNYRATLPRLFSLFRALGLRHVTITDSQNFVVGIVTRIDISRFRGGLTWCSVKKPKILPIAKPTKLD